MWRSRFHRRSLIEIEAHDNWASRDSRKHFPWANDPAGETGPTIPRYN
jgi:hypothetical protein